MDQKVTAIQKLESMANVLDKLADIPGGGRTKCGYIWVMNDLLNGLHQDILIYEDRLKGPEDDEESDEGITVSIDPNTGKNDVEEEDSNEDQLESSVQE